MHRYICFVHTWFLYPAVNACDRTTRLLVVGLFSKGRRALRLHAVCFSLENQKGNTVKWGLKCVRGTKARKERARKNRLRTLLHFLRISVSPATEKLIGQCAHSKVARAQWRYGSYVLASTRQRSVLFHKVSLNELEIHPIQPSAS